MSAAYFSLDPNRVLDIMLDCYEGHLTAGKESEPSCLLGVLGMFSRTSLVQVRLRLSTSTCVLYIYNNENLLCMHTHVHIQLRAYVIEVDQYALTTTIYALSGSRLQA
jgi:hypothetical protein